MIICKHCQLSCKKGSLPKCDKYQSKANRPEQLKIEIREAFQKGDYEKGKKLQEELFNIGF